MPWYAVRSVYSHGESDSGSVFSERVILFNATDHDEMFDLAQRESEQFVTLNRSFRRVGEFTAFALGENNEPVSGAEVWCMLFEAQLSPDEFYKQRYERFSLSSAEEG
jgi:hypothetical protein